MAATTVILRPVPMFVLPNLCPTLGNIISERNGGSWVRAVCTSTHLHNAHSQHASQGDKYSNLFLFHEV